jgi:hypothetical protein
MAEDRLRGPRLKIERAKEHIRELESEIREFLGSDPYAVVKHDEGAGGDLVYSLRAVKQPPQRWALIIGDAVHNLRSSLDHLACALVMKNGGAVSSETMFPIAATGKQFKAMLPARVKGASVNACKLIEGLKPYQGGNDALWRLHRLDIADKHRLLFAVGSAYQAFFITLKMDVPWQEAPVESPQIGIRPADRMFPLVDGAILFRIAAAAREGGPYDDNPKFTFDIAFGEGEVVQGDPVIPTLHQLCSTVEESIKLFVSLFET